MENKKAAKPAAVKSRVTKTVSDSAAKLGSSQRTSVKPKPGVNPAAAPHGRKPAGVDQKHRSSRPTSTNAAAGDPGEPGVTLESHGAPGWIPESPGRPWRARGTPGSPEWPWRARGPRGDPGEPR